MTKNTIPPHAFIIGASRGLGLSIGREAPKKMCILGTARTAASAFKAQQEEWSWCTGDIADPTTVVEVLDAIRDLPITHIFWVAGIHRKQQFPTASYEDIDVMTRTHFTGPVNILRECIRRAPRNRPLHLITIASTSSYRVRDQETLYCALKAAKAHFTRNIARELARDIPGSKTLLVNPGGMNTDLLKGIADVSNWMSPAVVAKLIWDRVARQTKIYDEMNILRQDDGSPKVVNGPQLPEMP